jgi:broad specificity phosphatase PhoE
MASFFITHPEVTVDPDTPVERWQLSPTGIERAGRIRATCWDETVTQIASSTEREAIEAADILANETGLPVLRVRELGENDRSATGFLPPSEFEAVADEFFAHPEVSVRGWETARDAQRRIVAAVRNLTADPVRQTAIVAHGAVGTLLYCDLTRQPISRSFDQPGQGSWFAFDPMTWTALQPWQRIPLVGGG